jgi:L,D-peptidoglycan transpeptidase YkuD (ErfK/YbiS/YcfS/YnhG family)
VTLGWRRQTAGMSRIRRRVAGSLLVATAATGAVTLATGAPISAPVTIDAPAERDVSFEPLASCDLTTVAALAARHPHARQFVVVATAGFADTEASLDVAVLDGEGTWRCQSAGFAARVGRAGTRALVDRRSGDDTTPAGVFPLGTATAWDGERFQFFGNRPDPGVRGHYRAVRREDCWGATPGNADYQRLVARPGCTAPDEWLTSFGDVYAHAAVIGANLDPVSGDAPGEPALAAAIFLHRHSYDAAGRPRPTSGCVSLAVEDLVSVLRDLDPSRSPHFAIGPRDWLRTSA